jgi:hypothetical protein
MAPLRHLWSISVKISTGFEAGAAGAAAALAKQAIQISGELMVTIPGANGPALDLMTAMV